MDNPTTIDREAAKAAIHPALHDLGVRIAGLDAGDCHCNLIAEVILDALAAAGVRQIPGVTAELDRLRGVLAKLAADLRRIERSERDSYIGTPPEYPTQRTHLAGRIQGFARSAEIVESVIPGE
jgi:hypothetical protein